MQKAYKVQGDRFRSDQRSSNRAIDISKQGVGIIANTAGPTTSHADCPRADEIMTGTSGHGNWYIVQ